MIPLHFGKRGFGPIAPEVAFDCEVSSNMIGIGFIWPDGQTEIIRSEFDQPLTSDQVKRVVEIFATCTAYGFNIRSYDCPVVAGMVGGLEPQRVHQLSQYLIKGKRDGNGNYAKVYPDSALRDFGIRPVSFLKTIDLIACVPRGVSLKSAGIAMGFDPVELPFDPEQPLSQELAEKVFGEYLNSDLLITKALRESDGVVDALAARESLDAIYGTSTLSEPDAKVGEVVICSEYGRMTGSDPSEMKAACRSFRMQPFKIRLPGFSKLPRSEELGKWFNNCSSVTYIPRESERGVEQLSAPEGVSVAFNVAGLPTQFGLGGLHTIDSPGFFKSDEGSVILNSDVVSFYPSMMSTYGIKPRALGNEFSQIITDMLAMRVDGKKKMAALRPSLAQDPSLQGEFDKAKSIVSALKVPLNAVYGKTANEFSPFYDRAVQVSVCVTGQLLLSSLMEMLGAIEGVKILSGNTDGVYCQVDRSSIDAYMETCGLWEKGCGMSLETEQVEIYARDSNNSYITLNAAGKVKTKGATFNSKKAIGKANSFRVLPYLLEQALIQGRDPGEAVTDECLDLDYFLYRKKVTGGATFDGRPIGSLIKVYPSTEAQPPIETAPNKNGVSSLIYSGCRSIESVPSEMPCDLDRQVAVEAARKILSKIMIDVHPGRNDVANRLRALGWRLVVVREGQNTISSQSKVSSFNFEMADVGIALGKGPDDLQVISANLVELIPVDVQGWVWEGDQRVAAVVKVGEVIERYRRILKKKEGHLGFALASKHYVIEGEGRRIEVCDTVTNANCNSYLDVSNVADNTISLLSDNLTSNHAVNLPVAVGSDVAECNTIPYLGGDVIEFDNRRFLQAIFGEAWLKAFIVSNDGAPDHPDPNLRPKWVGGPVEFSKDRYLDPVHGNYLSVSTFRLNEEGSHSRKAELFEALHWILLDDIGSKVEDHPEANGFPRATWELETSPGNFQFGFKLKVPETNPNRAGAFMRALIGVEGKPVTDPCAGEVTRLGRLPVGTNHKLKLGSSFLTRLTAFRPNLTYSLDELALCLGVTNLDALAARYAQDGLSKARSGDFAPVSHREGSHPIIGAFAACGALGGRNGKIRGDALIVDVICPWVHEHTAGDTSGTAVLIHSDGTWGFKCHHGSHSGHKVLHPGTANEKVVAEYGAYAVMKFFAERGVVVPPGGQCYADWAGSTFGGHDYEKLVSAAQGGLSGEVLNEDTGEIIQMGFSQGAGISAGLTSPANQCVPFAVGSIAGEKLEPVHTVPPDYVPPVEYVVDGLIANKLTLLAGPAGVGKTNMVMPLALAVCGAIDPHRVPVDTYNVKVTFRRRVVYLSEDVDQIDRCKYAYFNHMSGMTVDEFPHWFTLIPSKRMNPEVLAREIGRLREEYSYISVDQCNFKIEPLIIIDTSNANINLENENDNSEVGRAVAAIKESIGSGSCWLVCHTSKADSKGDVFDYSVRGAGAFIGDAHATVYLGEIEGLEGRHLKLGKHRFVTKTTECTFATFEGATMAATPWGETQAVEYLYTVPTILKTGELGNLKSAAKAEAKAAGEERRAEEKVAKAEGQKEIVLGRLRKRADDHPDDPWVKRLDLLEGVHERDRKALLDRLIAEGLIDRKEVLDGRQRSHFFKISKSDVEARQVCPNGP